MARKKTYLGDDLEFLALAEFGLGNGLFDALDGLVVEFLITNQQLFLHFSGCKSRRIPEH